MCDDVRGALLINTTLTTLVKNEPNGISARINGRARMLFMIIIFFLLTLVNAVFAVVIANLFVANPEAVIPIVAEIPLAIAIGVYIYRSRSSALLPSIVGVLVLYALILVGNAFPVSLGGLAEALGMGERTLWIVLLFAYTWIASRIPVWVLLQPRDYINSNRSFCKQLQVVRPSLLEPLWFRRISPGHTG